MARNKKTAKKGNTITVNFEGVEGRTVIPEGDYAVKIISAEQGESNAGNPKIDWKFEIIDGDFEGKTLYYTSSLVAEALWKLRSFLEAVGVEIPEDEMELDLDELIDAELNVSVNLDTYEGKKQSKIVDFWPIDGDKEDEEEEEEEKSSKKSSKKDDKKKDKKSSKKSKKEEDEPEKISAEEVQNMDEDELAELVEERSLDVDLDDFKTLKKKANAVIDALEAEGQLEDE